MMNGQYLQEKEPPHSDATKKDASDALNKNILNLLGVSHAKRPDVSTSYVKPTLFQFAHEILATKDDPAGHKLYVGPKTAASERALNDLRQANIVAIVNCTVEFPCYHWQYFKYCRIRQPDAPWADLLTYLQGATTFIHKMLQQGSVLVHCEQGMSRSAAVAMAYLMRFHNMTRDEAYVHCKSKRPMINPNDGFWNQLESFEQCLLGDSRESSGSEMLATDEDSLRLWTQQTQALFATCAAIPQILEAEDCWKLLDHVSKDNPLARKLLTLCLDFVWGRGVNDGDIEWLLFVCRQFPSKDVPITILRDILADAESEFSESWAGEIDPKDIKRLLSALDRR